MLCHYTESGGVQAPSDGVVEAEIAKLESDIRQLKIQYDMFFAGGRKREPIELRGTIERTIKRYTHAAIRKYHHRFHFNALVARFNTLSELWGKTVRAREVGDRPAAAVADRAGRRHEKTLARCQLSQARAEDAGLKQLHDRFIHARRKAGDSTVIPYEAFVKKIAAQANQIKQKTGCDGVELRVVVNDRKVQLKARPAS
jgi:hypothetical protein